MAKETQAPASEPKPALPALKIGHPCRWYSHVGADPRSAIATKPGNRPSLVVFDSDYGMPIYREAVYHVSDPKFKTLGDQSAGLWDFLEV